ncbi:PREDICTED: cytochrome P450 734A1-like isoform 2 [Fragaria vesca subsp. vesca]
MEGGKMEAELFVIAAKIILTVLVGGFLFLFFYLYELLILRPEGLRSKLQIQGIKGPPPSFLLGNVLALKRLQNKVQSTATKTTDPQDEVHHEASICHQWPSRIFPHIEEWRNEYGPTFMYALAHMQQLCITDVELLKELGLCTSLILGTPSITSKILGPLLGKGLLSSNGLMWAHQRKTIAPELYHAKVKGMMDLIVESTTSMLKTWESEIQTQGGTAEIRVDENLRKISGDIIARACFQSNYSEGKEIFSRLRTLQKILSKGIMGVEGLIRWLPTNENREIWRLEKEIESMILKVVKQRSEVSHEKDLLQMILQGAETLGENGLSHKKFIIDNCKTIFIAAYETTAVAASWSLMLLAVHADWQARVRAEVLEICGDKPLHADMLPSMKVLTMVIQEVLRLYSPVFFLAREVFETITLKNVVIPKGVVLQIPIPFLHQDPDIWGPDAHKFNPERFANGVLKACNSPQAYMPFGLGPRICVGQHLAMTELKETNQQREEWYVGCAL